VGGVPLPEDRREAEPDHRQLGLRVVGAGLLVATGAVHLDLYLTGYRTVPTIGWLFLLQVVFAFGLGLLVLVSRSLLVSAAGAGFAIATLGGYLLSLRVGLFGFREVRTTAGIAAGVIEVGTFVALAAFVLGPRPHPVGPAMEGTRLADKLTAAIPAARWAAVAFSVLVAALFGVSLAATGPASTSAGSSGALLKIVKIHGVAVVTNAQGYTLYWFAPDTPTKSTCYGTCAAYWPPLTGNPVAGPGVTGRLGTIERSGGETQVTYDGHPLYTYVGDSAPGQANGNDINLNGGLWYEMAASG
jgi:predicted lipoprotein with Yx(FWY)xxD motif